RAVDGGGALAGVEVGLMRAEAAIALAGGIPVGVAVGGADAAAEERKKQQQRVSHGASRTAQTGGRDFYSAISLLTVQLPPTHLGQLQLLTVGAHHALANQCAEQLLVG